MTRPLLALLVLFATLGTAHADKASVKKLAQARVDAAAQAYAGADTRWQSGTGTIDAVGLWSERWLGAQRDQPLKGKALTAALADHLQRMQTLVAAVQAQVAKGVASTADADVAAYYLAEAELWSARGK
jgi:hypothetical protein